MEAQAVTARLASPAAGCRIEVLEETDSTNTEMKRRAAAGMPDGAVLIARRQTGGRGRQGRRFFSPEGGLYMSVLLRRAAAGEGLPLLTVAAGTAVAEAVEELTGRTVAVKWVNDLYLDGRKICGILAEAVSDGLSGVQCAVVGIGVNVTPPPGGFPEEVRERAGALFPDGNEAPDEAVAQLAAGVLNRLMAYAEDLPGRAYLPGYRARSLLDGRTVAFCENGVWRRGVAEGVDDNGRLRVRLPDGTQRALASGEVTMHGAPQ